MTDYTISVTSPLPFTDTVEAVREELQASGFGILTEIDVQATLAAKLGAETEPMLILGACKPPFAHRVLQADPSVASLLPCNVVVRKAENAVMVDAFDPMAMTRIADGHLADEVQAVAADAHAGLASALERLASRAPAAAGARGES